MIETVWEIQMLVLSDRQLGSPVGFVIHKVPYSLKVVSLKVVSGNFEFWFEPLHHIFSYNTLPCQCFPGRKGARGVRKATFLGENGK